VAWGRVVGMCIANNCLLAILSATPTHMLWRSDALNQLVRVSDHQGAVGSKLFDNNFIDLAKRILPWQSSPLSIDGGQTSTKLIR
jgi:hypothetical protein